MAITESQNPNTLNLDQLSSKDLVKTFLTEDRKVISALEEAQLEITDVIDMVHLALESGGRLFYLGAGTSGRLGILDAVECPPTFSTSHEMVQGIIAGGDKAIKHAVEGAEDDEDAGFDFVFENLTDKDILIGITASGSTPFVIGALKAAKEKDIKSVAISNNADAKTFSLANKKIFLNTGAEVISGSTRLKAGTSQKMVLNIISSSVMVKLGKVYGNLMVDLKATNKKLIKRATNLVMQICNCSEKEAHSSLEAAGYKVKNAVIMHSKSIDFESSEKLLKENKGFLSKCL